MHPRAASSKRPESLRLLNTLRHLPSKLGHSQGRKDGRTRRERRTAPYSGVVWVVKQENVDSDDLKLSCETGKSTKF